VEGRARQFGVTDRLAPDSIESGVFNIVAARRNSLNADDFRDYSGKRSCDDDHH
jgi:hypothetical protein